MTQVLARRDDDAVPLSLQVDRDGGIAGLTVVMRIFNGTDFLDFNDGTFKAAGHTTPTLALSEVDATEAPGLYAVLGGFDLSAVTIPASADSLLVVYTITAGGETGNARDTIVFEAEKIDEVLSASHGAGGWEGTEKTRPHLGVGYVNLSSDLSLAIHAIRDGVRVTPTAFALTWRNPDGTTLFSLTQASAGVSLDGDDVYRVTLTQALLPGLVYRPELSVTDGVGVIGPRVITVAVSS